MAGSAGALSQSHYTYLNITVSLTPQSYEPYNMDAPLSTVYVS